MVTLLSLGFWLLTAFVAPLFGFLALVTVAALSGGRARRGAIAGAGGPRPARFLVVIPAHDEEGQIAATVASCRALDYDPAAFTVVVIADNCTDATARDAREAGAEVVERFDPDHRSKGYALEYFFEHADATGLSRGVDAFAVIDADTLVDPNLLTSFAAAMTRGDDWAQCYYTVRNPDASWRTRLLTYAFSLFNGVWLLGQDRLGLSVGFRGNGMCFTTRGLARVPWQSYGLVEDLEFSWTLRLAGERVRFLPQTRVYAEMVSRGKDAASQRRRWEEGRRALRDRFLGPLLTTPALSPLYKMLAFLDLLFPPLMPLFLVFFLAAAVHPLALAVPGLATTAQRLLPVHALMALTAAGYALSPFLALGLPLRYLRCWLAVPYFAAWKILATLGRRTTTWERTRREVIAPSEPNPAGRDDPRRSTPATP